MIREIHVTPLPVVCIWVHVSESHVHTEEHARKGLGYQGVRGEWHGMWGTINHPTFTSGAIAPVDHGNSGLSLIVTSGDRD